MTKGYLILAQNGPDVDYLNMSYALAMSIKASQPEINKTCLIVDEATKSQLTGKHLEVFDYIVDIPFSDDSAHNVTWKIQNKWKYAFVSPFIENIILDSDVLFTESIEHWWKHLKKQDVWFCTTTKTFRNETVTDNYYRKKFIDYKLPNIYTNFTYFKQSDTIYEIAKLTEMILKNWQVYYEKFLQVGDGQNFVSADLAYALAVRLLDLEDETCNYAVQDMPTFVHMKSYVQNINHTKISGVWKDSIPSQLREDLSIDIGNYRQTLPVHYVEKDWLTPDMVSLYEKRLGL